MAVGAQCARTRDWRDGWMEPICSDRSDVPICHSNAQRDRGIFSDNSKQARIFRCRCLDARRDQAITGPVPGARCRRTQRNATQANGRPAGAPASNSIPRPATADTYARAQPPSLPLFAWCVGGRGGARHSPAPGVRPPPPETPPARAYIYGQATAPPRRPKHKPTSTTPES